jgi:serine/threonine protein kinase
MPKAKATPTSNVIKSVSSGKTYHLLNLLGEGGFGTVWRCRTGPSKTPLCLKLTKDQGSWHREAYMAELLGDHPRVVHVYETFPVIDGKGVSYAVVMELAESGTLADVVEKGGAWPEARALSEMSKVLGALEKLHASGALHRDVTPYNIFACGPSGTTLKLGDFGITTHGPKKGVRADAFAPWFVDTAIREEQRVRWDVREDLWQTAQVLAVLLTGKVEPLTFGKVRKLPCSDGTKAVIARATGSRSNRFESAKAMAEALKGVKAPAKASKPTTLKGRNVVFTGQLGIARALATELAIAAGAAVGRHVSATTDLLVVGTSKLWAAGGAGGRKILAAAAKREGGRHIDLVDEAWFLKLVT